jgi:hypothetical protein
LRFPIAFQAAPALLLLVGTLWLPYSPRWLMQQNRYDEAYEAFKRLHRTKGEPHDTIARKEFYQMKKQVELDRQINATVSRVEIFKTAPNCRRALIGCLLMWGNQFTGVLIIANYGVILFVNLGMKTFMPLLLISLWVSTISFF